MRELYIENEKQLNKNIFKYKSFLYKKVLFLSDINDEDIKSIIKALNIKDRKKRNEYVYDYCCSKIDNNNSGKNVCGFCENKCILQQKNNSKNTDGCCRNCTHQHGKGCETSNLSCKLFFCDEVEKNHKILKVKDLKILKLYNLRQIFIIKFNFFSTREEIIKDVNNNSIILFGFRISIRGLKNYISKYNKK